MKELSTKTLDSLKASIDLDNITKNNMYYEGKNPTILGEKKKRKPDNKIPVALGYRLISNLSGYAARTGDIFINQVPKEGEDTNESDFEKKRKEIDEANNGLILNSLLYIGTLKQGISYDVVWTERGEGSNLEIKYAQIPNYQAVPVWKKELQTVQELEYFVRFWDDTIIAGATEQKVVSLFNLTEGQEATISYAQVFEVGGYHKYIKYGQSEWVKLGEFVEQPFTRVQVSAYRGSTTAAAYIEPVMVLLDQMDKLISRNVNELERFNNSLLGVLKKIAPEVKQKIDEVGVIDDLISGLQDAGKDVFPRFISRDIPTEHAQFMFNTLGKLVYQIMGSVDFSDESFGTASGVALLYRLIGLEYSAVEIDTLYDMGLMNRNALINEALGTTENDTSISDDFLPVIAHIRNMPIDISFLAKSALDLKAIGISTKSILKMFPKSVIPDVQKELDFIAENTPKPSNELLPKNSDID